MRPERIKQLRSSIRLVPELVRASMITQAFELEKLITATIDLSEGMEAALRSLPQAYREALIKLYRDLMYKAYDAGHTNASFKQGQYPPGTDVLSFIRDKMPLPYSLEMSLLKSFTDETATFLKTVESKEAIYEQFKKDIEKIYCDGAMEYLNALPPEAAKEAEVAEKVEQPVEAATKDSEKPKVVTPEEVRRHLEEYAKLAGSPEGANVLRTYLGLSAKAEFEEEAKDNEKPKSGVTKEEIIRKFEEYAAKAGTPEGTKVLRYYLGLPVQASVAKVVGSYEIDSLRKKVLALVQDHSFTKDELQTVVVDSVAVAKASELASALGIADLLPEGYTVTEAKMAADELAEELTKNLDLPGTLVFADLDDSLVLAFSFKSEDYEQQVLAAKQKAKSELPASPMGALDKKDQDELAMLAGLDRSGLKMMVLKDLKKTAPKVVDLISEYLTKTRNSEFKMGELAKLINAPMLDVVEKAYGRDGAEFYKHVSDKKPQV
jgi:hypothetical protein